MGDRRSRDLTEEPPRRISFLTLDKFSFNRDGKGVLNSPPPQNILYHWFCSQRQLSRCISLCPLFPEPTAGKEQAKRLEENGRSPKNCRWVYSLLAGAAAEAPDITISTHNPSGRYQVKLLWHTTQSSRWPPGVSDLSCYIICKVIVYRHGVRGLDQSAWMAPSCQFPHILHITPVTYPTTFSENKHKPLKNWLSNTLQRATESRPTWKNMEKAKIAPEIPPLAGQSRSHSRDSTQHRSFSLRTEGFKHSTSDNPAFKTYIWERGPPKYWLLKATGTCATRPTHLSQFGEILTCSCARTHPHGPSVEASDRGEPQALCVWDSSTCRGASAWRQETYLTPTCGPTGMTSQDSQPGWRPSLRASRLSIAPQGGLYACPAFGFPNDLHTSRSSHGSHYWATLKIKTGCLEDCRDTRDNLWTRLKETFYRLHEASPFKTGRGGLPYQV